MASQIIEKIRKGEYRKMLSKIYDCSGKELLDLEERFIHAIENFETLYGEKSDIMIFSAPGRVEIGGNHTDHQGGCVLASAVSRDAIAVVSRGENGKICVNSKGFMEDSLDVSELDEVPEEAGTSLALIRGICKGFAKLGYCVGEFNAYTESNVQPGSGLSSSAAFEVLIGTAINGLFCRNEVPPLKIAQIGQFAENTYFKKPCGLMDQAASAIGGLLLIDFSNSSKTIVEQIPFDFSNCGYQMCIIDTKGNHADLTPDYAAIPAEMKKVAAFFGKDFLSQIDETKFYESIKDLRTSTGDRAVLRAIHFFEENARVKQQSAALKANRFDEFKHLVIESGRSSFMYLQNVYSPSHISQQGVAVALALCEKLLAERGGAWRVHGGGFAGTVQAYVPNDYFIKFAEKIESVFGKGTCCQMTGRQSGGIRIL